MTPSQVDSAKATARHLASFGVRLFLAKCAEDQGGGWDTHGGTSGCGYWLPEAWQTEAVADPAIVDRWQPGLGLAAVMGDVIDCIDIDPRNGGSIGALDGVVPTLYGRASTPSGGEHLLVAALGIRKITNLMPGIDIQAGVDGRGCGFIWIAPTHRASKVDGQLNPYLWTTAPDLSALALMGDDGSGAGLRQLVLDARGPERRSERPAIDTSVPVAAPQVERAENLLAQFAAEVAACEAGGRNDLLIRRLPLLYRFVLGGCLEEFAVDEAMEQAASDAGIDRSEFEAVRESAWGYAESDGPDRPDVSSAEDVFSPLEEEVSGETGEVERAPLPRIDVSNDDVTARWLQTEVGKRDSRLAGIFIRGGSLVFTPRINQDGYVPLRKSGEASKWDDGIAQVQVVKPSQLIAIVTHRYRTHGVHGIEDVPMLMSTSAANVPINDPASVVNVRALNTVTHTPMMLPDGSVLDEPGWRAGVMYLPGGLAVPPVAIEPSQEDLDAARDVILAMLQDFPWNSVHDRANYLSLLILPLIREMFGPPYKLSIIHARQRGSGKSLLAWIARELHGGVFRGDVPPDGEEFRKQVTTILTQTTGPVVQWDNVKKIGSRNFDALLSSSTWSDRALGSNTMAFGVNDRCWVATGNNVTITGDLGRRTRWITIDPDIPHPEWRTDFQITNLKRWVADNRGVLLHALLTLVRSWVVAGQPVGSSRGEDDYARSTEAVQGVLVHAGIEGRLDHASTVQQEENEEDEVLGDLLADLYLETLGGKWTVGEVTEFLASLPDIPEEWIDPVKSRVGVTILKSRVVGHWFRKREGQWSRGYSLKSAGNKSHTAIWTIKRSTP